MKQAVLPKKDQVSFDWVESANKVFNLSYRKDFIKCLFENKYIEFDFSKVSLKTKKSVRMAADSTLKSEKEKTFFF